MYEPLYCTLNAATYRDRRAGCLWFRSSFAVRSPHTPVALHCGCALRQAAAALVRCCSAEWCAHGDGGCRSLKHAAARASWPVLASSAMA